MLAECVARQTQNLTPSLKYSVMTYRAVLPICVTLGEERYCDKEYEVLRIIIALDHVL